jgi:hypothetical protein
VNPYKQLYGHEAYTNNIQWTIVTHINKMSMGEDLIAIEPFFKGGHVLNGPRIKIPNILEILITYSGN